MSKTKKTDRTTEELDAMRRRVVELEAANNDLAAQIAQKKDTVEHSIIFRKFAETSGQGFGMGDLDGRITWSNAALARILGFENPEDVVGTLIPDYYSDDDRLKLQNEILPTVIEKGMNTVEIPLVSIHGHATPTSQAIFLIRDNDGNPYCFANVLTDISERKRAEEALRRAHDELEERVDLRTEELRQVIAEHERTGAALRQSEENLSITLNSIGDAVIATDAEGKITRMNPVAEKLTGWTASQAKGLSLDNVFHVVRAGTRQTVENPVENVMRRGDSVGFPSGSVLVSRDGSERQIADSGAPIREKNGDVIGIVLVFRDVTDEYALLEQLRQAQKMDAIGQLAGGVAHDFNNLLTGILGNTQLLMAELDPDSALVEYARDVFKASMRAADLTQQLLAFSRKGPLQTLDVDVHRIIDEVVELLSRSIDKRIEITTNLEASQSFVRGDPTQLQNALLNLGVNARDAMPEGGKLTFSTRVLDPGDEVCRAHSSDVESGRFLEICVTDNGVGMDSELMRHIFEPFFTTKEINRGTGLGLAGAYGCITSHDGYLDVSSEPGKGSKFKVLLPVAEFASPAETVASKESVVRGVGHVLIVDDEGVIRSLAAGVLSELGYDVASCTDGAEAVDYYREHHSDIDLVILDVVMPRLGGEQAFQQMMEINPDVRALIISGFSHTQTVDALLAQGAVGFLKKPFRIEELAQKVAEHIRTKADPA